MADATLTLRDRVLTWTRPLLMGVVNANPDSFSDPGPRTVDTLVERATRLVADGATLLDIGAQSAITRRPPMNADEEAELVVPVVTALRQDCPDAIVSVDTYKPSVVDAVLAAGAHLVNDVSGLRDRAVARRCAAYGAGIVVMHTAAPPLTRLQDPDLYTDGAVAHAVAAYLQQAIDAALTDGVDSKAIVVDPGVDFTKTPAQTVALLHAIEPVVALGRPILLALSRKDFVGALTRQPPSGRGPGTLGAVAALRHVPGQILRVHDVAATRDMLLVLDALTGEVDVDPALSLADDLRHEPAAGI